MNTQIQKAAEIISQNTAAGTSCVLALIDSNGYPTASTITASKSDGIKFITFGTGLSSNKAKRIQACGRACVCFSSEAYNITLVGDIEIATEPEIKKETWYDGLENHFSGPDDPNFCVLRFTTKRYNLMVDWTEVEGTL